MINKKDQLMRNPPCDLKPIMCVVGPTASGKSGLALQWAMQKSGIIVNGDSQQVYQHVPILTAQPTLEDQTQVLHRLYHLIPPDRLFSVIDWIQHVVSIHQTTQERLWIVGGTGFYIKTLLEGLSPIPEPSLEEKAKHRLLYQDVPLASLQKLWRQTDPDVDRRPMPIDRQRVIRALEILSYTGKSLWFWHQQPKQSFFNLQDIGIICLNPPRNTLRESIQKRWFQMEQSGVLEETKALLIHYPQTSQTFKPLGLQAIGSYLDQKLSHQAMCESIVTETCRYAKRQTTWFRHQWPSDASVVFVD